MSKLLGVIKAIIGQVYVVDANGTQRLVHEGDRVYSGEEIVTGASGAVSLSLPDGKTLDIGRNSHWGELGLQVNHNPEHDAQDIAAVQKAIADGADPTQVLEATAAGNDGPVELEGGGGGHTLVQLELTGQVVDPTAGFNTKGLGSPNWDINLPVGGEGAGSASVFPPEVQITEFAGNDGFINKSEFHQTHLSGTSNQNHVTLTFTDSQKNTFTVEVPVNNGHWNINTDLGGLVPGNVTVVAIATDVTGRTAESVDHALIDITGPDINISVESVTPDNLINYAESRQPQTMIHGSVGGDAKPGDIVTLLVDGKEYTGVVTDPGNGALIYTIPVQTQGLLNDPNIHATLTSFDDAGNRTTVSTDHHVDTDLSAQNAVTIEVVANDDVVNANEFRMPTVISGVASGDAKAGDPVTLTLQGKEFHGTVFDDHGQLRYEIVVPSATLKEGANEVQVTLVSHDDVGNEAIAITHKIVTLDTQAANVVSIDTVAGDDTVNLSESRMPTLVSGTVTGDAQPGDPVSVLVNNQMFTGRVVSDEHGALRYTVAVPTSALAEGRNDVQVTVIGVDAAGNTAVAVQQTTVVLDTHAENSITIDNVTADNALNFNELSASKQMITGTVSGEDASVGDSVHLEINGHHYAGQVIELGNNTLGYQIEVDSTAFANNIGKVLKNVNVHAMVISHDAAGNEAIATYTHKVHLDNYAENQLHIDSVAGDDVINIKESTADGGITDITGTVAGADAKVGDVVTLVLKGAMTLTTTVVVLADGTLGYSFPVNTHMLMTHPEFNVTVTSTDDVGNIVTNSESKTISYDMYTQSHISIDRVTADNVINIKEATDNNGKITISGYVSGDAKLHDIVELMINGQSYQGQVETLANGNLGYQIVVDTQNLINDPVIHTSIHTTDDHGNETTATAERIVGSDLIAGASIGINTVAGDDIISKAESLLNTTTITGAVDGDAKAGDVVTLTFNKHTYSSRVVALPDGTLGYSIPVSTKNLPDGSDQKIHVSISTVDDHGNPFTATSDHQVHIDLHAEATIGINSVTGDNVLNNVELEKPMQLISGTVGGDARIGDLVSIIISNQTYTGKVIDLGGGILGYQIPVDSSAFSDNQGLQDRDVTFTASVTSRDAVGNEVTETTTHKAHIDNYAEAGITVDTVAGDNMLNGAEAAKRTTEVMGTVSGDAQLGDKVHILVNGKVYGTTVQPLPEHNGALGYKLEVLSQDLVKDPHITAQVVGVDTVGNIKHAQTIHDLTVDLHAKAMLTIDPVAGDNRVNGDESRQPFTWVTGKVGGDVHVNDVVYLTVNGHVLTGKVTDSGNGDLGYKIKVSTADLLSDPHLTATVSTTDGAGNPATADAETTVIIDTRIDAQITIDAVTPDNTLNHAEQTQIHTRVSGTVKGEVHPGDPLVMTVNGHKYTGVVEDLGGNNMGFHVQVATSDLIASPHIDVSMDVTDAAQNHAHITAHHDVALDDIALASITIDPVTGDNILNGVELQKATTLVSGTVGGDAKAGDIVHLNIGGHLVDTRVIPLPNLGGTLGYSVDVKTQWLQNDPHITATITTMDLPGNTATAHAQDSLKIDDHAIAIVHIDPLVTDLNDSVISFNDAHNPLTKVSGTVEGDVGVGDFVLLTINNQSYYAPVQDSHGQRVFSTQVSTLDLLMDPKIHASVSATDAAGNTAQGYDDMNVAIDTVAEIGITIDSAKNWVPQDLNAGARPDYVTVVGHVDHDAQRGDPVYVDVGHGHRMKTAVDVLPDGKLGYTLNISTDYWDNDGNITVTVVGHDQYGNTATAVAHKYYDLPWVAHVSVPGDTSFNTGTPPSQPSTGTGMAQPHQPQVHLTVDKVAGDDVLNRDEAHKATTPVRGMVTGDAHVDDIVTVTVNGVDYHGKVFQIPGLPGELGYQVNVPSTVLEQHPAFDVSITVHNGNLSATDTQHKIIKVDTQNAVTITMDRVAGDDVINAKEALTGKTTVSGTVSGEGIHDGSVVSLQVNGNTLTAVVHEYQGTFSWSQEVAVNDLRNDPKIIATVNATDAAGNVGSASAERHIVVDLKADAGVTIGNITADNVLNAQESDVTLHPKTTVTGSVTGDVKPGDPVTLEVNQKTYTTHVDGNGRYSVDIDTNDLNADQSIVARVTGHDSHGNDQDASYTRTFTIDKVAVAGVTINTVGGDDIINADEMRSGAVEVSGTVEGDVHKGDKVQITVNGVTVEADVIELPYMNGRLGYSAQVSTTDLQADPNIHVSVTGHDAPGNVQVAIQDKPLIIDTQVDASIVLDKVATDNVLNDEETQQPKTTISGYVTGDVDVGDLVTIRVNGKDLVAQVTNSGGKKVFSVDASTVDLVHDQNITAHVTAHDDAGNRQQIDTATTITIDRVATGSINVDNVKADNILNQHELLAPTTLITGHVGGDAQAGDPVSLKIGNTTLQGFVTALSNSELVYQIAVDTAVLKSNMSFDVTLTGHDTSGNPFVATSSHTYSIDDHADGTITIHNGIAGDNVINQLESLQDTILSGTVTGDAKAGDIVTLTVNGQVVGTTSVIQDNHGGRGYTIAIPTSSLNEGGNDIAVTTTVRDAAGNTLELTEHKTVVLDTHAEVSIVVDKVAGDNHISRAEALLATTHLTGSVTGDMVDGDHIKARVNGKQYDATIHQIHNELRYDIEVDTSSFHAGHNRVNLLVEAHDDHGNITPYTQTLNVTMDDSAAAKGGHSADKHQLATAQHAAMQHALHNLFDDSALSLSYSPAATGHGHGAAVLSAGEKAKAVLDKVDLSDLARELHEGVDIAKYIQSGGDHHQIASPAKVAHGIDTALSTHASGDLHSATYSLDHLIARPDHNPTH